MIFRAALGFAVALTLLYGQAGSAGSPALAAAKADIARQDPDARLKALLDEGASRLSIRIGTVRDEIRGRTRARRLHP